MKSVLILAALLVGSFAQAETAVYKGDLAGTPVTLTISADQSKLTSHYIACDSKEDRCDAGQYAFFTSPGEATVAFGSETGVTPLAFALYTAEENVVNGKLNGAYTFVDRTGALGNKVSGITFYQDAQLQNKVQVAVTGLKATAFVFPSTYTVMWDNHDDGDHPHAITSGSLVLVRQ